MGVCINIWIFLIHAIVFMMYAVCIKGQQYIFCFLVKLPYITICHVFIWFPGQVNTLSHIAKFLFFCPSRHCLLSFSSLLDTCDEIIDMIQQAGDGVRYSGGSLASGTLTTPLPLPYHSLTFLHSISPHLVPFHPFYTFLTLVSRLVP